MIPPKQANLGGYYGAIDRLLGVDGMPEPRPIEDLPDDPVEFVKRCVFTFDERAHEHGLIDVRPFPVDKPHLLYLMRELEKEPLLWVEKSSQIMVTWAVAAFVVHRVLTIRAQRWGYRCMERDTAAKHIESRMFRIYQNIPVGYRKPVARLSRGEFEVYHDGLNSLPTAFITPIAAETDASDEASQKTRSQTWSGMVDDESAFTRNQEEIHGSTLPRTGRYIKVSTPNGKRFFWRLGHGQSMDRRAQECLALGQTEPIKGIKAWFRHGFRCLAIHHSSDPDKDPATPIGLAWRNKEEERLSYNRAKIARELDISSEVASGDPVFDCNPTFDIDGNKVGGLIVKAQKWDRNYRLLRGWDFGYRFPFVVFAYAAPKEGGGVRVHVLREGTLADSTTDELAEAVLHDTGQHYQGAEVMDGCDFHGGTAHTSRNTKTDIEILSAHGLIPFCQPQQIKMGVELIQKLISLGDLEIDPQCVLLVTALRSGYVRNDDGDLPNETQKGEQHPYCDAADAFRYIIINLLSMEPDRDTGPVRVETIEFDDKIHKKKQEVASSANDGVDRQRFTVDEQLQEPEVYRPDWKGA